MSLGMEVGLGPGHIVVDGDPATLPKKGAEPPIFGPFLVAKRLDIKMALGIEVGLGPGHIVLDGDPAPLPQKGDRAPQIFGLFLLSPNGWMHQDATLYGGRPQPRRLCVRWYPASPPLKGHSSPNFWTMFVVAKRLAG